MPDIFRNIIEFIKAQYPEKNPVPLHEPRFIGNETKYLNECIHSTYVSYVGEFVAKFEEMIKDYTGVKHAVSIANGTLALHIALVSAGVKTRDEVVTQAFTFVATANAISHCGARPVFVDSERETLGMSPEKLEEFLSEQTLIRDDGCCYNKSTGRRISACVPVHIFGHPVKIEEIVAICTGYNIPVIEDAAESLVSLYKGRHTGTVGKCGILSFNGNKIVTTGGGGMVITDNEEIAKKLRHIATTAKVPHKWEFIHDDIGYNYRMPNINAAIGCAQMESLAAFIEDKRELAREYGSFFAKHDISFFTERNNCRSNYWLNVIILRDRAERDEFLEYSYNNNVITRPAWRLMNRLEMYKDCQGTDLEDARWLEDRIVNIPSSVRI